MSIQKSINSILGSTATAVGAVGKQEDINPKANPKASPPKQRTQTFQNFNPVASEKAKASLKNEIEGRKQQKRRIKKRMDLQINTDPRMRLKEGV